MSGINIDKTKPVTTAAPDRDANNNGWYKEDVTVTLTAADKEGGSGVALTEYSLGSDSNWTTYTQPIVISNEGQNIIYYRSKDLADNLESAGKITIKLDKTAPEISGAPTVPANANGWWNTDVTIHFTANDPISGIQTVTPDIKISTEGQGQTLTGTAVDRADNEAFFTVENINIDKTKPEIIINSPVEGMEYTLNENVPASWSAADTLSGIETAAGTVADGTPIDTATVGTKTFTVEAVDLAGNKELKTLTYYVRYNFSGLLEPIANGKVFKGNTVPVKFRLTDAQNISVPYAVARLYLTGPGGTEIEAVSTSNAVEGNLFRYDNNDEQYIFNMNTGDLQAGIWQLQVALDDGTSKAASIELGEAGPPEQPGNGKEKENGNDKDKDKGNGKDKLEEEITPEQPAPETLTDIPAVTEEPTREPIVTPESGMAVETGTTPDPGTVEPNEPESGTVETPYVTPPEGETAGETGQVSTENPGTEQPTRGGRYNSGFGHVKPMVAK